MTYALEFEHVTKKFGDNCAVEELSFRLEPGAFLGLLGRNGAGKTTSINLATGLLRPTSGRIRVLGQDVQENPIAVKRQFGVMPQEESSLDCLSGPQYLNLVGSIHGLDVREIERRGDELFALLDLAPEAGAQVRDYSYGMKKKLGLCAALLHGPRILFLDEPFEGIDPVTSRTIKEILSDLRRKQITVLMSSHVVDVVEKLCPLIAIIDKGRLIGLGSLEELQAQHGGHGSLEEMFVALMGGAKSGELSWL